MAPPQSALSPGRWLLVSLARATSGVSAVAGEPGPRPRCRVESQFGAHPLVQVRRRIARLEDWCVARKERAEDPSLHPMHELDAPAP